MNGILDSLRQLQLAGMDVIEAVRAAKQTPEELAREFHMTVKEIERMLWLFMQFSHVYHRKLARAKQLSIKQLEIVATGVNKCSNPQVNKLKLREEFIINAAELSTQELKDFVATKLRTLNRGYSKRRKSTLGCSKSPDQDGMGHVHAKLPFSVVRQIHIAVHKKVHTIRKKHPGMPYDQAIAAAFQQIFNDSGGGGGDPDWHPVFLYALNSGETIQADGKIATNLGCVMELKDILDTQLAPFGYVVTYALDDDGMPQPIATLQIGTDRDRPHLTDDQGRDQNRLANWRQRFLATLEHPICAHPECNRPALTSDMHHVDSWLYGGRTELTNLAPLCRVHNARNDDKPGHHKNGRIEKCAHTGRIGYRPHPDAPMIFDKSEVVAKSARNWAIHAFNLV